MSVMSASTHAQAPEPPSSAAMREIAGTVTALNWSRSRVELQLISDDGSTWLVRMAPLAELRARGIERHMLATGTALKVAGQIEPGDARVLRATNLLVSPTREIVLQPGAARRWIGAPP
jgi:hypothetical protein